MGLSSLLFFPQPNQRSNLSGTRLNVFDFVQVGLIRIKEFAVSLSGFYCGQITADVIDETDRQPAWYS